MDNERQLQTEFRRALDDVLPPAPWLEAVVVEELRKRRPHRSVVGSVAKSRKTRAALPRSVLQLAAAMLVVLLAASATVAFLELRHRGEQSTPVGMLSVKAYQQMVGRDWAAFPSPDGSCSTLQSVCPRPGQPYLKALQRWQGDLNASEPPAPFSVIDAQLRQHLAANILDVNTLFAAFRAKDQTALDLAYDAGNSQNAWLFDVAGSIVGSVQETPELYMQDVRLAIQNYLGCLACQALISSTRADCADMRTSSCVNYVTDAAATVEGFESTLVRDAAPDSLAWQDAALQGDLAKADTGILQMADSRLTGSRASFDTGRVLLGQALPAIDADVAHITPPGVSVPARLLGDWFMPAAAANSIDGGACPTPLTVATCMFELTFTATTYTWTVNAPGSSGGNGDVVANGSELDFFNGQQCGAYLPAGVGRYSWTLTDGVLHFAALNQDICPRAPFLANQSYTRTGS